MSKYKRENQRKVRSIYVENDILDILAQVDPNRSKAVAILAKYWQETHQSNERESAIKYILDGMRYETPGEEI